MSQKKQPPEKVMPIFLDFEASSLDPERSYPVEVGWVDSEAPEPESHLIQPDAEWGRTDREWDPNSARIHGRDRTELEVLGTAPLEVARRMNAVMAGRTVCVDSPMDPVWADKLFTAATRQGGESRNFAIRQIDDLLYQRRREQTGANLSLTPEAIRNAQVEAKKRITQDRGLPPHQAGNDALILLELYRIIILER